MRCGCPECGVYMVQQEQGLQSGCVCPHCRHRCRACVEAGQEALSPSLLRERLLSIEQDEMIWHEDEDKQ